MKQYVQHISGTGEKWEVAEVERPIWMAADAKPNANEWLVCDNRHRAPAHLLPKSEYRICEPPEVWEDCTEECTVNGQGSIQHNGVNTMVEHGYRRRKVHVSIEKGTENWVDGWAVIIEKKVSR